MDNDKFLDRLLTRLEVGVKELREEVKQDHITLEKKFVEADRRQNERIEELLMDAVRQRTKEKILIWAMPIILTLVINIFVHVVNEDLSLNRGNRDNPALIQRDEDSGK